MMAGMSRQELEAKQLQSRAIRDMCTLAASFLAGKHSASFLCSHEYRACLLKNGTAHNKLSLSIISQLGIPPQTGSQANLV